MGTVSSCTTEGVKSETAKKEGEKRGTKITASRHLTTAAVGIKQTQRYPAVDHQLVHGRHPSFGHSLVEAGKRTVPFDSKNDSTETVSGVFGYNIKRGDVWLQTEAVERYDAYQPHGYA